MQRPTQWVPEGIAAAPEVDVAVWRGDADVPEVDVPVPRGEAAAPEVDVPAPSGDAPVPVKVWNAYNFVWNIT